MTAADNSRHDDGWGLCIVLIGFDFYEGVLYGMRDLKQGSPCGLPCQREVNSKFTT